MNPPELETTAQLIHRFKNQLAIIVGFCDLVLGESAADDPRRADLIEIHNAAREAMRLMPDVARRMR